MSTSGEVAVGDVIDEVTFAVEAGKVAEFARATRVEDPVHTNPGRRAGRRVRSAAGHPHPRRSTVTTALNGRWSVGSGSRSSASSAARRAGATGVPSSSATGCTACAGSSTTSRRTGRDGVASRRLTIEAVFLDADGAPTVEWREVVERGVRP